MLSEHGGAADVCPVGSPIADGWCPSWLCGSESLVTHFLLVCLAGAAGTGARYALATGVAVLVGSRLPYGTMLVNILGSFAMGIVVQLASAGELGSPALRVALTTGFLGGFTTYSAFNNDTVAYLHQDLWGRAFANVTITLVGCLVAGFAGVAAARRFAG